MITIVNGGPWDEVDVVINFEPDSEGGNTMDYGDYYEGIETELFKDRDPGSYTKHRVIFTVNDEGSIDTATYLFFKGKRRPRLLDFVADEDSHNRAMWIARLVLWCESCINNDPKAVEGAMQTSILGKRKLDEEICPICHADYHADDMIATLRCGHSYHRECIWTWLMKERECPICRADPLPFPSYEQP